MKSNESIKAILADMRNALVARKQILSVDDLSTYTGLSKSTIYKLTYERTIPHYKPGGKLVYFNRLEIENWLQSNPILPVRPLE